MKTNFRIKDNYAIEWEDNFIDLHNCFNFIDIDSWMDGEILIKFKKCEEEWVSKDEFSKVDFVCVGINYQKFESGKDLKNNYDRDTVNYISFSSLELRDSLDTFESKETPDVGDDFVLGFEDGSSFRINCNQLTLVVSK